MNILPINYNTNNKQKSFGAILNPSDEQFLKTIIENGNGKAVRNVFSQMNSNPLLAKDSRHFRFCKDYVMTSNEISGACYKGSNEFILYTLAEYDLSKPESILKAVGNLVQRRINIQKSIAGLASKVKELCNSGINISLDKQSIKNNSFSGLIGPVNKIVDDLAAVLKVHKKEDIAAVISYSDTRGLMGTLSHPRTGANELVVTIRQGKTVQKLDNYEKPEGYDDINAIEQTIKSLKKDEAQRKSIEKEHDFQTKALESLLNQLEAVTTSPKKPVATPKILRKFTSLFRKKTTN